MYETFRHAIRWGRKRWSSKLEIVLHSALLVLPHAYDVRIQLLPVIVDRKFVIIVDWDAEFSESLLLMAKFPKRTWHVSS